MHIGFAGPISLDLLNFDWSKSEFRPKGYPFAMTAFLVNGFLEEGHEVTVFTTSDDITNCLTLKQDDLKICIAKRQPHAGRDLFKSERKDLIKLMKTNPVDIINAHWSYEFAWAALNSGTITIVTLHDYALAILKYQVDPFRIMRYLMNFIVLKKSKYLTVNSDYLYQILSKKQKLKAVVISNFIDLNLEKVFRVPRKKFDYIISISNGFGRRKNIQNGLKAFRLFKIKYPEFKYYLVGNGMERNGLANQFAEEKNLLDGVEFLGPLSFKKTMDKVAGALILLHPSREESFGMAILESQVTGTIVIAGKKSGNVPNLIYNGITGYLCDVEDPSDIAKALVRCIENPIERKDIESEAKIVALEKYSSKKIVESYLDEYKKVLRASQ